MASEYETLRELVAEIKETIGKMEIFIEQSTYPRSIIKEKYETHNFEAELPMIDNMAHQVQNEHNFLVFKFMEFHRLDDDDGEYYVWSMIIRQFRLMLVAREVLAAKGGVAEVMKALHCAEYPATKAIDAARRFTMPRLEQIYHQLLEIDEAAKTGRMPLDVALDVLVVEIAR